MSKPREWFRVENKTDDTSVVDIHIIDVIGGWDSDWIERNWGYDMGVTARKFVDQLAQLSDAVKTINLHINSPGGDVQAGINIANALREQQVSKGRTVAIFIDGLAASIASVIAMAGSTVSMADNALMMVHNPYALAIGNAAEMRKTADVLDTMRGQIIATYKWHSALEDDALAALMDAETWMNADEAIANGFATHKVEGLKAAASLDTRAMGTLTVPEKYRAQVNAFLKPEQPKASDAPQAAAASDVLRLCTEGGCLDVAESLVTAKATLDQVKAKIEETKATKAAAATRESAIRTMCANAKLPTLADAYVSGGMSVEGVKAQLITMKAELDKAAIDTSIDPDQGSKAQTRIDVVDVYAKRNT